MGQPILSFDYPVHLQQKSRAISPCLQPIILYFLYPFYLPLPNVHVYARHHSRGCWAACARMVASNQ